MTILGRGGGKLNVGNGEREKREDGRGGVGLVGGILWCELGWGVSMSFGFK